MVSKALLSRRLLVASIVFGLFVLFDIALFGWLIFRSLSQREIEEVLLETRAEAETLAGQIAQSAGRRGSDLYTAIATEQETLTLIDQMLLQRELVLTVEIRNPEGVLVYRGENRQTAIEQEGGELIADPFQLEGRGEIEQPIETRQWSFEVPEIEVPIGRLGRLEIGLSPQRLAERISVLRRDLVREAAVIGAVTVALLLTAYLAVFVLFRRARRAEEQAAEAERLAYIGTLASGLAHEIRNPLNSLNLNLQMIEEDLAGAGAPLTSGRLVSITRSELGRLERLVSDFLAYARPRPPELEEVPAAGLLERVRAVMAGASRRLGASLEAADETGGAILRVDPAQIAQLLLNLVQNAIEAAEEAERRPRVRLTARRRGTAAVLTVADNGAGIPDERRERIFDLFYSTRKGGTGLGLAIVRRIAQNHGGRIEVESRPGEGTEVSVVLPGAVVGRGEVAEPVALEESAVP